LLLRVLLRVLRRQVRLHCRIAHEAGNRCSHTGWIVRCLLKCVFGHGFRQGCRSHTRSRARKRGEDGRGCWARLLGAFAAWAVRVHAGAQPCPAGAPPGNFVRWRPTRLLREPFDYIGTRLPNGIGGDPNRALALSAHSPSSALPASCTGGSSSRTQRTTTPKAIRIT
jgi:hypothetical protein